MSPEFRRSTHLFTSESVTMGHPDKVADQISDAVLDALLAQDPKSRVAVETLVTTGQVVLAGEVTTEAYVDAATIARDTIREIGYTHPDIGFDAFELLRRHVLERAEKCARSAQLGAHRRGSWRGFREPEVQKLGTAAGQHDV